MKRLSEISSLPSWMGGVDSYELRMGDVAETSAARERSMVYLSYRRPKNDEWSVVAAELRRRADVLRKIPIGEIIRTIDRVSELWCDSNWPLRVQTREQIVGVTGLSAEVVDWSIDLEMRNYRRDSLERMLERELGDPSVLDCFRPVKVLEGKTRALGPKITVEIFTGNVPALPALEIVRALVVKSAVIAKVASGEPIFASRFVESLRAINPDIADAILITYWGRKDQDTLSAVLRQAEAVVVYGGMEACRAVRQALPAGRILIEHGHKVSYGMVSKAYLASKSSKVVADLIVRDTFPFNQHACISPRAYFVEGSMDEVCQFAETLSITMERHRLSCPIGNLSVEDAATLQMIRAAQYWRSASDPDFRVWTSKELDWTVVVDKNLIADQVGNRYMVLIPVHSLNDSIDKLKQFSAFLQNVALGLVHSEMGYMSEAVAKLGACRICEPGRMAEPTLMWRHDGRADILDLVRWCDVEMHPWVDNG